MNIEIWYRTGVVAVNSAIAATAAFLATGAPDALIIGGATLAFESIRAFHELRTEEAQSAFQKGVVERLDELENTKKLTPQEAETMRNDETEAVSAFRRSENDPKLLSSNPTVLNQFNILADAAKRPNAPTKTIDLVGWAMQELDLDSKKLLYDTLETFDAGELKVFADAIGINANYIDADNFRDRIRKLIIEARRVHRIGELLTAIVKRSNP
jgi:hypothetical protein